MEGGGPGVIPNAEGTPTRPSVVAATTSGDPPGGRVAQRQAVTNPENTVYSIKRFMGRKLDGPEVQRDLKLVPYSVSAAPNGDASVKLGERQYSPPEVSAM